MAQRPGVMLYFDVRPCLKRLNREEKGLLFEGILDYAELGVLPEFDGMLGVAWDFIQPRLDRDCTAYEKSVSQKKYATYCRQCKKTGEEPVDFETWVTSDADGCYRSITADNGPYPTTTTETTSTSSSKATADAEGGGERNETREASFNNLRNQKIQQLLDHYDIQKGE